MTREQELLSGSALAVFRLNGQFLGVTEQRARPACLTATWWQVLGAVLREPRSVAFAEILAALDELSSALDAVGAPRDVPATGRVG